jgi:cobalt/nickel transport system permease protein
VLAGTFVAAWVSVMVAAFATSAELVFSGTSTWNVVLPAMMGVHAFIGVGEGLISVGAVAFVMASRPDLLRLPSAERSSMTLQGEVV